MVEIAATVFHGDYHPGKTVGGFPEDYRLLVEQKLSLPDVEGDRAMHPKLLLGQPRLVGEKILSLSPYIDPTPKFLSAVRKALKGLRMVSPRSIA